MIDQLDKERTYRRKIRRKEGSKERRKEGGRHQRRTKGKKNGMK